MVLVVIALACIAATAYSPFRDGLLPAVHNRSYATPAACVLSLLLLGIVWSVPHRTLSSGFLTALAGIAGLIILLECGGRLRWRFAADSLWQRTASPEGCLMQSTGSTCGPAAAVMYLHHYGIPSSEGEMAYLANTSPFGTGDDNLADALSLKAQPYGWKGIALRTDYDTCLRQSVPVIALLKYEGLGGHAIFVERMTENYAEIIDPMNGLRRPEPRERLERLWDGRIVRFDTPPEEPTDAAR